MYMKVSRPGPRRRQQRPQALRKAAVSTAALKSPEWRLWKAAEAAPHSVCAGAAEAPLAARVGWRPASSSGGTAKADMLVVRRIELLFRCLFPSVVIAPRLGSTGRTDGVGEGEEGVGDGEWRRREEEGGSVWG